MSNYSGHELVMIGMEGALPKLQIQALLQASIIASAAFSNPGWLRPGVAGLLRPESGHSIGTLSGFSLPSQSHNGVFNNE